MHWLSLSWHFCSFGRWYIIDCNFYELNQWRSFPVNCFSPAHCEMLLPLDASPLSLALRSHVNFSPRTMHFCGCIFRQETDKTNAHLSQCNSTFAYTFIDICLSSFTRLLLLPLLQFSSCSDCFIYSHNGRTFTGVTHAHCHLCVRVKVKTHRTCRWTASLELQFTVPHLVHSAHTRRADIQCSHAQRQWHDAQRSTHRPSISCAGERERALLPVSVKNGWLVCQEKQWARLVHMCETLSTVKLMERLLREWRGGGGGENRVTS